MVIFADPPGTTAQEIAEWLVSEGWLVIADPSAATGQSLAIALEGIGYHDFADPATVTPQQIAELLNDNSRNPLLLGAGLRAWRAW